MNRKVKITFEIEEVTFFKTRKVLFAFCEHCNSQTELLSAANAALLMGLSEIQINRLAETDQVHFIEAGEFYLCRNSLEFLADGRSPKLLAQNIEIKNSKD